MRIIKFRAWDKEYKRMFLHSELEKMGDALVNISNTWMLKFDKNASISPTGLFLPAGDSNMTFMQYTGLRDDNGKFIFESDLVEDCNGNVGEIKWSEQEYKFVFDVEGEQMDLCEYRSKHLKIIGNIHENPELLQD